MPGIVLSAASRVLATDLAAFGRPDLNVWAMSAVVVVNVVANLLLIPHFGIVGAALATTLAWGVHAAIELVLYARTSGNHWWIPVLPRWSDVVLAIDLLRRATTLRRT